MRGTFFSQLLISASSQPYTKKSKGAPSQGPGRIKVFPLKQWGAPWSQPFQIQSQAQVLSLLEVDFVESVKRSLSQHLHSA